MGIFNEFYKKEKPFFTGIARGFGFGGARWWWWLLLQGHHGR